MGDRLLATKMGVFAVDELLAGKSDLVVVEQKGEIVSVNIAYSQVLDRLYKGTLKEGMLEKFSAEKSSLQRRKRPSARPTRCSRPFRAERALSLQSIRSAHEAIFQAAFFHVV